MTLLHRAVDSMRLLMFAASSCCLLTVGLISTDAHAAAEGTVNLLATPPELTSSVAPNLVLTFDDSGSMGRNYMPDSRPFSGAGWGGTDQQNVTSDATYPSGGNPYLCAGIIDPTVTDPANPRSWAMNGVYYNPNANYRPPLLADGTTQMTAATFTAAWHNGIVANRPVSPGTSATVNLGTGTRFCGHVAGYNKLRSSVVLNLDANGKLDAASQTRLYTASNWEWVDLPTAQRQNFANWYSYYHTRHLASRTAISRAFAPFDENIRIAWQNINSNLIANNTGVFKFRDLPINTNVRTRFYTWLFSSAVSGNTPNQTAADRVGKLYQRATGSADTNPYWDRDLNRELSCRQNFHIQMTDGLWNNATVTTTSNDRSPASRTLPDGRTYAITDNESKIIWNELGPNNRSMADIAFHYWATDLRPDFATAANTRLKVPPFMPDRSTNIFGTPLASGEDPRNNKEIYWNPANDPATWPHLVQFMIGFGVDGTIPNTAASYDSLRRGNTSWPLTDLGTDDARKIDDMWHAAINSRGQFFAASNPEELIQALSNIISSIISRRGASTAMSVSLPIVTDGTTGYAAGYDTTDWSGFVTRNQLDPQTAEPIGIEWDASCKLTGGACPSMPGVSYPVRAPSTRQIITSSGVPGTATPFRWANLTQAQRDKLNINPQTIRLDLPASANASCGGASTRWSCDTYGERRVDYLRGDRTNETTVTPRFRVRSSVLGAVVKAQPEYVSSPTSGYRDIFPAGSPESTVKYAAYQNERRTREPTLYVGANDGMLHAFDAQTGDERWAYVPNTLIENLRLTKSTEFDSGLTPGVDAAPGEVDVFFGGEWRTLLLGSMRLGGRGIYALDVTNPLNVTEGSPVAPLWEFDSGPAFPGTDTGDACAAGARHCRSLGYTYDAVNVARLKYGTGNNHWFAIVASGYFPTDVADPASNEIAAGRTSLLVINVETGELVREIQTSLAPQTRPTGFRTFGLSTPLIYDQGSDQIDDFALAGDLAGNLWRFDLSDPDPANWSVDLMFTTYGNGGAASVGNQPISFMPTALRDPVTLRPIFIFGTGKYIGLPDRTSLIPEQAYYGIRDMGANSDLYPIRVNQLVTQNISQPPGTDARSITSWTAPVVEPTTAPLIWLGDTDDDGNPTLNKDHRAMGWRLPINIGGSSSASGTPEGGERAQRRAAPLFSANLALLYSLIPKGEDPCDPGARYSLMVVDGATGGARTRTNQPAGTVQGIGVIGGVVALSSPPGNPVTRPGGGGLLIPGLPPNLEDTVREALNEALADDIWHRNAWRELLNLF